MLIDTDVLIWYMRGNKKAYDIIENHNGFSISVINYIELLQGLRNKSEFDELRKAIKEWDTGIIYISEKISAKAMFYMESYYLSHSLSLADSLVGATAAVNGLSILTGNDKHYKQISEIKIIKFRP